MDLRQLRYFVRIVECGSLTRAAASLYISQPSLGEHVRNLEREFGVELLQRHSRGVRPTEAGAVLMQHAEHLLAYADATRRAVQGFADEVSGGVTLGFSPGLNEMLSPELIGRCRNDLPGVALDIVEDLSAILVERLVNGSERIDMALVSADGAEVAGQVDTLPLAVETLFAVGSPTALGGYGHTISFEALARHPLILLGDSNEKRAHGVRRLLEAHAAARGMSLDIKLEVRSVAAVRELLECDFGVALLPLGTVHRRVEQGALRALAVVDPAIERVLHLVWNPARAASRAEVAVRDCLVQLVAARCADPQGSLRPCATADEGR